MQTIPIPKDDYQLSNEARAIAEMIAETIIDQRTDLFRRVARLLGSRYDQHYTATLFKLIGELS
jgi:hypothetical protein